MILSLEDIRLSEITPHPRALRILAGDQLRTLFILDRYLPCVREGDGFWYHSLIDEWLSSGLSAEYDLQKWLEMKLFPISIGGKRYERARFQAEDWLRKDIRAATWIDTPLSIHETKPHSCPRVLYGIGDFVRAFHLVQPAGAETKGERLEPRPECGRPWVAVFNSRKSRQVSPHDPWLTALRLSLEHFKRENVGVASSIGTTTYDLVTAWAQQELQPLLLVTSFPLEDCTSSRASPLLPVEAEACTVVTCRTRSATCARATSMVCRDRLLAMLVDSHWALELRAGGNLLAVLQSRQAEQPCPQWIMHPKRMGVHNGGNSQLLKGRPEWARVFVVEEPSVLALELPTRSMDMPLSIAAGKGMDPRKIPWQDYLYHYTRSCPGPWPDQSYRSYLSSLLGNDPLSAHTALDTLIRMLKEGLIRAGAKLVRGNEPVVSWTRVPPMELRAIRQWNPALIRWTFEPYGIAVSRKLLRDMGAKPTLYVRSPVYSRLDPEERYRFQRHEAPECLWKQEKEWRLRGDFALGEITDGKGFVLVPGNADAERLRCSVRNCLPVVVTQIEEIRGRS